MIRVAQVHSVYSSAASGENIVVDAEHRALVAAGYSVTRVLAHGASTGGTLGSVRAAGRVALDIGRSPLAALEAAEPDVVHVHNLFPSWTSGWIRKTQLPVVRTVHNYRSLCANAVFVRDGKACRDCLTRSPVQGLRHGCYRGSRAATAPLTTGQLVRDQVSALASADHLLFPSAFAHAIYADQGLTHGSVSVLPPFLPRELVAPAPQPPGPAAPYLYVGRLSPEKGLGAVMDRWPQDGPALRVVGDGPERSRLQAAGRSNVHFLGALGRQQVMLEMASCKALLFSSTTPETFGLVYLEALAAARPVLALSGSAVADNIDHDATGVVVSSWQELPDAMGAIAMSYEELSARCHDVFHQRYSEDAWLEGIAAAYDATMKAA